VGREVDGFPKKMAQIDIADGHARLVRNGRPAGSLGEGPLVPLEILDLEWRPRSRTGSPVVRAGLRRVLELGFFNELSLPALAGREDRASLNQLTWVRPSDVVVRDMGWLAGARLRVGRSSVDPLFELLGPEPSVSPGIGVDFGFTIGAGEALPSTGSVRCGECAALPNAS
jgi:hypothetical protein